MGHQLTTGRSWRATAPATAAAVFVLFAALALVGCSGATGESGTAGESGATSESGAAREPAGLSAGLNSTAHRGTATDQGNALVRQPGQPTAPTTNATLLSRSVIQRAGLTVHTGSVGDALVRTRVIVDSVQGVIASEQTETNRHGAPRRSILTLRVPVDSFGEVLGRLKALGRLGSQQVSVQDVTTEVIDVEARIVSAQRTLNRIRDLLERANSFSEILSLEGELARREADLASLQAQQAYLEDQTSLSTIDLTLLPRPKAPAAGPDTDVSGFLGGLKIGWDALAGVVMVALTALGVVAPLLLLLVPAAGLVWWGVRRFARRPARQSATG